MDKGFLAAETACGLTSRGHNRHFIIAAKARREVIDGSSGDALVQLHTSSQARKKSPDLPECWQARGETIVDDNARKRVLLTSLHDRKRHTATDIAMPYAKRWQIETSYRELKRTLPGLALLLRNRTIDGVYQEIRSAHRLEFDSPGNHQGGAERQMRAC